MVGQSVGPIFVLDLDLRLVPYSDGKLAIKAQSWFTKALVGALGEQLHLICVDGILTTKYWREIMAVNSHESTTLSLFQV